MKESITLLSKNLALRSKEQMNLSLSISPQVKEFIVNKYTDLKMGARPLKRAIQSMIEDSMAEEILQGNIKNGQKVHVVLKNEKIAFQVK